MCTHTPDDRLCLEGTTCDPVEGCPARTCTSDGDCDDGRACNGIEVCDAMACVAGTPIDCDDMDACTADSCDEALRGECAHRTRDADGDGFGDATCPEAGGVPATDCVDTNPDVSPDGIEVCNGTDDDCAAGCDDGFTCCRGAEEPCMTSCRTTGRRVCDASCTWSLCSPPAETCNGTDDDCNGAPDDVFACVLGATEACTTMCGSPGTRTCEAGCTWSACSSGTETCNGADDDCDGTPDDGFACVARTSAPCATTCDPPGMMTGSRLCDATACTLGACVPPPEGCTGRDDDCDGDVDESTECTVGAMEACTTSCGSTGMRTCNSTCRFDACAPPAEICNGSDDDCDGTIDEGFTCVPSSTRDCTTGCSTMGSETCQADCTWGTCAPSAEACNGADDDCDTMCDEAFECCAGSTGPCTTICDSTGTSTCGAGCTFGTCTAPAEACNGVDDDCDGTCDNGFPCCAGRGSPCMTSCGSSGTRACASDCTFETMCVPPAEICNGLDDDCDTMVDDGFACTPPSTQFCTTSCGSTGTQICDASCGWGMCTPPTELCNGVDDNCDTAIDEGCGACSACTGAVGVVAPGGRFTVPLRAHAQTGTCGGAGAEAYLTFTLTAPSDVFVTTHGTGARDTVIYVRECSCGGTERGCNDDADGLTTSALQLTALPAGTYNVIVDTEAATTADVIVDLYFNAATVAGDRCGSPTPIPAGTTALTGNTCAFGADYQPAVVTGCNFIGTGASNDRVYYFYLPTSRTVTFNGCTLGSTFDSAIYVRGVCTTDSAANLLACNDDGCTGPNMCDRALRSSFTTTLGPGLFYFFADGYQGGTCDCGDFDYGITGL